MLPQTCIASRFGSWKQELPDVNSTFNPDGFIGRIGERLVEEFKDSKVATTPSTVGSAAEQPVRDQLAQILPRGTGVGEGFVIDSYGGTSRQQDAIVYERDICPVFSVNNTPQTTYYPCEGVIAVCEVKSSLDRNSLEDAFEKVASAKRLRRHVVQFSVPHPTTGLPIQSNRHYLTMGNEPVVNVNDADDNMEMLKVSGFVLAGETRMGPGNLVNSFVEFAEGAGSLFSPNLLVTLDGHSVCWGRFEGREHRETFQTGNGTYGVRVHKDGPVAWQPAWSAEAATHAGVMGTSDPFRLMVRWIRQAVGSGRTSGLRAFDRYFGEKRSGGIRLIESVPKGGDIE